MNNVQVSNIVLTTEGIEFIANHSRAGFKGPANPTSKELKALRLIAKLNSPSKVAECLAQLITLYLVFDGEVEMLWLKNLQMAHVQSCDIRCGVFDLVMTETGITVKTTNRQTPTYSGGVLSLKAINEDHRSKVVTTLNKKLKALTIESSTLITDVFTLACENSIAVDKAWSSWYNKEITKLGSRAATALKAAGFSVIEIADVLKVKY